MGKIAPYFSLFIVVRLTTLYLVYWITGGKEIGDDVFLHQSLIQQRWDILLGQGDSAASAYPPLLPILESLPYLFFQNFFSDFFAVRFSYLLFECFFFVAAFALLGGAALDKNKLWPSVLGLVFWPQHFFGTMVLPQDEIIPALVLASALLLWLSGREKPAVWICACGVIAAKIFLLIPLMVLLCIGSGLKYREKILPLLFVALVYALQFWRWQGVPLLEYTPSSRWSIGWWGLFADAWGSSVLLVKWLSLACGALASGYMIFLARARCPSAELVSIAIAGGFVNFFLFFYLVNPEYFTLLSLPLLLGYQNRKSLVGLSFVFVLPWIGKIFFGLANAQANRGEAISGKRLLLSYIPNSMDLNFEILAKVAIAGGIVALVLLALSIRSHIIASGKK